MERAPSPQSANTRAPKELQPPRVGRFVLVAEDDAEMRRLLVEALRRDGHEVMEAVDGMSLFRALQACDDRYTLPDVIVSDIRRPGLSGLEVVDAARRRGWEIPVLLITAFGDEETLHAASRLGATVFSKPFDVEDLRTVVLFMLAPSR